MGKRICGAVEGWGKHIKEVCEGENERKKGNSETIDGGGSL